MTISRRRFLRGAAGAAIAIPFLPSLMRRRAYGSETAFPRRFVCIYTANGQHAEQWLPTGTERNFALSPVLAPLAPYIDKCNVVHNVRGSYGHQGGHSECLTGRPSHSEEFFATGGPSLDQLLAEGYKSQTALPSIELGIATRSSASSVISYSAAGLPIPCAANAAGAFDRVVSAATVDPETADRHRRHGRSVLDTVIGDYRSVQPQLSTPERHLLDAHLTLLREQEARLETPIHVNECTMTATRPTGELDFPTTCRQHMDTIAAAFTCDTTRVATLMIGSSGHTAHYEWAGVGEDFHEVAHGSTANAYTKLLAINRWHAEQVAYLLGRLDAIPEGSGTVLDNTVVFWTNEIGLHTFSHSRESMPLLMAGSCGGYFETGRFVDMGGAHYHDVLLTLAHAMGRTDVNAFGDEGRQVLSKLRA